MKAKKKNISAERKMAHKTNSRVYTRQPNQMEELLVDSTQTQT